MVALGGCADVEVVRGGIVRTQCASRCGRMTMQAAVEAWEAVVRDNILVGDTSWHPAKEDKVVKAASDREAGSGSLRGTRLCFCVEARVL